MDNLDRPKEGSNDKSTRRAVLKGMLAAGASTLFSLPGSAAEDAAGKFPQTQEDFRSLSRSIPSDNDIYLRFHVRCGGNGICLAKADDIKKRWDDIRKIVEHLGKFPDPSRAVNTSGKNLIDILKFNLRALKVCQSEFEEFYRRMAEGNA